MKCLLVTFFTLSVLTSFAQNNEPVLLRWKLKPNEVVMYKTTMKPIDTATANISFSGMFKKLGANDTLGNSMDKVMEQNLKQLAKEMDVNTDFITQLSNKKNAIEIQMHGMVTQDSASKTDTNKSKTDFAKFKALIKQSTGSVTLRAAIYDDGSIQSFYLKSSQKNLVEVIFQLPEKSVKVGDSWPVDVSFIGMDQNFICDTSYKKNVCTLTNITEIKGEHIATIQYDIVEYIGGTFSNPFADAPSKMTTIYSHRGIANFSIERGRLINYSCIIKNESSGGIMSGHSSTLLKLSEQ